MIFKRFKCFKDKTAIKFSAPPLGKKIWRGPLPNHFIMEHLIVLCSQKFQFSQSVFLAIHFSIILNCKQISPKLLLATTFTNQHLISIFLHTVNRLM
jgi:hypothetical protein